MLDLTQAHLFLDLQRYLFCLSEANFREFAKRTWPTVWEHMCDKWGQSGGNPWNFMCGLDLTSFNNMVRSYNRQFTEQ